MAALRILFTHMESESEYKYYQPLWPCYLASFAENKLGSETITFRLAKKGIQAEIESFRPHIIAIGSVSRRFNEAIDCARKAKQYGLPTIVGGIHISTLPECLTEHMDVGCIGEGEETFVELLAKFIEKGEFTPRHLAEIQGIVYRDGTRLIKTPTRAQIQSFDQIPHPKRSLVGYSHYNYLLSSRGCPYNCFFCACKSFWGKTRYASPAYVLEEIHELVDNGAKVIRFEDDTLTTNKKRLREIADLVIRDGLHRRVEFMCWARANEVNEEVAATLKAMNTYNVWMGLESGSQRTLDYLKGHVTVEKNMRAIEILKDAGIKTYGFFIIGSPQETAEDINKTYKFIKKSRLDQIETNILTPLPGTRCWDYFTKGKPNIINMDWSKLFSVDTDMETSINLSEKVSNAELYKLYRRFQKLSDSMNLKVRLKKLKPSDFHRIRKRIISEFSRFYKKAYSRLDKLLFFRNR